MINKYMFHEKIRDIYPDNPSELLPFREDDGLHLIGLSDQETKNRIIYGWRGFEERKWLVKLLDLQDGQKILELGSCWGDQSIFIGENIKYGTIYALDPLMSRQRALKNVLEKYAFEHENENRDIVPVAGDLFSLGFKENSIDRILAADVIDIVCEVKASDIQKKTLSDKLSDGRKLTVDEALKYAFDKNYFATMVSCLYDALESMHYVLKPAGKAIITGETWDIEKPQFKLLATKAGFKACEYVKSRFYHDIFDEYGAPCGRKRSTFHAMILEK